MYFSTIAIASQLAQRGMNIVVMSRTKAKLDQVAKEIGIYVHLLFSLLPKMYDIC